MSKNISYHTRLYADNTTKVYGGSFDGELDLETANRLTCLFTVIVKPSGTPVFVDREGREVRLYISVDVESTEIGKKALTEWRKANEQMEIYRRQQEEQEAKEITDLMAGLSHEEIVQRLRGGN